jgi:uncharacterized protein (TIGR02246 family)
LPVDPDQRILVSRPSPVGAVVAMRNVEEFDTYALIKPFCDQEARHWLPRLMVVASGGREDMLKLLLSAVCVTGLATAAAAEDVRQAIEQVNARFVEAFKAGDAAAIASLYTETAKMLPPDATEIAGREAIQAEWQSGIDDGLKDLTLEAQEVEASGDLAYEIGAFSLQVPTEHDDMATAGGNYVVVWQRGAENDWRLHVDTWNDAAAE